MYKITSTEERNEKATDFETKTLLYMMNYYPESKDIHWFVIDFFNDVTGVDKFEAKCFDSQSKGVKNITPNMLGKYLVTLFKNYISDLYFVGYILFVDSVSSTLKSNIAGKTVFCVDDLTDNLLKAIKDGLKQSANEKTYIENKNQITDVKIDDFLKKVTFVIDSHSKEEYIKDAVSLSPKIIVDDAYLRKIFKQIRDMQSSKKNNNVEGVLIDNIGEFYKFDKYILKEDVQNFIINRICFHTAAFVNYKKIPVDFSYLIADLDETIRREQIEKNCDDIFRLICNKNNSDAYWKLFAHTVELIRNNPKCDLCELYEKIDKQLVCDVFYLNAMSCKLYIAMIKETIDVCD